MFVNMSLYGPEHPSPTLPLHLAKCVFLGFFVQRTLRGHCLQMVLSFLNTKKTRRILIDLQYKVEGKIVLSLYRDL